MARRLDGRSRAAGATLVLAAASACAASLPPGATPPTTSPAAAENAGADAVTRSGELMRQGRYEEARALLEPALAQRPDWADAHVGLALTYVKQERWETARKLLERSLELDPGLHRARLPYAWCLYYLGELDGARAAVGAFLEREPNYADAVFALGLIEFDSDDLAAAEKLLRRVILLGRERRDTARQALAHARLSDVYVRRGEPSRARLELKRALELVPDDPKAHFKMSRVLRLLGDADGAAQARRRYEALLREAAAGDGRTESSAAP